ncbi:uncharacterized protein LOC110954991 [Acanthochromis polyacanthus]|uniref:uncharacterized protein LOC110954991 n=1 Tax=Acanthochromis polyacanthus TaxID=80966 RepID=UPI000B8F4A73|nr:uncharacterized protein LOC110954991 [Acanthochromis polyacanthus]
MVHSGSASPMKTTSSSPDLTVPATAPPLVPPAGCTTDRDVTETSTKLLTTDLTFNSDLAQPPALTPANAEPPLVDTVKSLSTNSSPASDWSSAPTPNPAPRPVNGRTSGRKRTPKACDCCGPNSAGHNARNSGRGRGRSRGRGRGAYKDLGDTPKRKVGQLTRIKSFDLTKEQVEEAEDEGDVYEKVEMSVVVADTQPQTPVAMPVTVSLQGGPMRNCGAPEKGDAQIKEKTLTEASGVAGAVGKGDGNGRGTGIFLLGTTGRGALVVRGQGRGMVKPSITSKTEVNVEIKGGVVISSKADALNQSVLGEGENQNVQMHHGEQICPRSVVCPLGNGDTVNLSDTEGELEEDNMIGTEPGNALLSILGHSGHASRSETPQDLDCEMQVDQIPDGTDQVSLPVTLSNGNVPTLTDSGHKSTATEMETHPASSPSHCPITVSSVQHDWALGDHRLYCQPGTWEKNETEEMSGKSRSKETDMDEKNEETLEQLTDMIHDFLESFYIRYGSFIPLSESDVLEHLKKKGNSDLSSSGLDIKGEMTRYRAGLASAPIAGFMVTYNKHTLSLEDLGTLEEQNWLNDQIINMYGELIMEATEHKVHFFNSFFHKQLVAKGYDGVKRWTKKVDLFSKWLLLIPIHLEIHWSLVTVTMATKTISYFDSQGIVFRHTTDNIMKYLQSEAREKKQTAFQKGWKVIIIKGIPQQKNDSDCGVFVLEYCRRLSVKQPLQFSQEDMPRIRKRIYKELCDRRLND